MMVFDPIISGSYGTQVIAGHNIRTIILVALSIALSSGLFGEAKRLATNSSGPLRAAAGQFGR